MFKEYGRVQVGCKLGYVYGMSTLGIGVASGNIFCGFGFGTG